MPASWRRYPLSFLPRAATVRLSIYSVAGQLVEELLNEELMAGQHQATWHGQDGSGSRVPSGMYFYRLEAGEYSETRKMILLK